MLPFGIGQRILDRALDDQLKKVFPSATAFSPKQTSPVPHFIAYTGAPGFRTVAGYVFWTTELEPLERGYDGPIKILVGLGLNAKLTGVLVTEHHEPYGYFSVDPPRLFSSLKAKIFAIHLRSERMSMQCLGHRSRSIALRGRSAIVRAASLVHYLHRRESRSEQ